MKWTAMIAAWNENPESEDPYAEPTYGEYFLIEYSSYIYIWLRFSETSLNDVRKQFADEDAEDARRQAAGVFPVSMRSFISIGLELEERQSVITCTYEEVGCLS